MASQFRCPTCEMLLKPSNFVSPGSRVRCPQCRTVFTTPETEEAGPSDWRAAPSREGASWPAEQEDDDRLRSPRARGGDRDDYYDDRPPRRRSRGGIPTLVWILGGVGLMLLLGCGLIAFLVSRLANPEWQDFNSPEGSFTATYPGSPKKKSEVDALGNTTTMFFVEADWGHIAYFVGYTDIPGAGIVPDPGTVLDAAASVITTVKSKKPIRIDGHPGLEVDGEMMHSGTRMDVTNRIYLVGSRMYQVMVVRERSHQRPADFAKFLDSFRLTGGVRAGPR
jgi:phage FluMu protein Com